ncbi:uncharacterized protein LOC113861378 isoform X2 [Abrus precatorius]|uniref:Uncharacterized protein LOC113861378 isoform X2 n=1 Tax=Abrus precatorius TaxID=3816 RepID=A0A8B8L125_ABRPR|nr:uncharacterized protein LOC113861378 isoform X2 [Abrus precatorius]
MIPSLSLSLSLCVRFPLLPLPTVTLISLSFLCDCAIDNTIMDAESEKLSASTSSASSSFSSSSASEERVDRLLHTQEIEAAETLAHLAMRDSHSADKWRGKRATSRFTRESPTPDSDLSHSPLGPGGKAVAGQHLHEKISTTASVETERIPQDDSSRHMKVEQDAGLLPKTTSYSIVRCSKSRRNLTEEEKEARRIRRVLANRESARQTIRRRQALCEELTRKAATLVLENENLKKEKELALKEYQSLETTNKHLKAQIAKSVNAEVEKTPVEPKSSVTAVTPLSGNSPWFLYNHFPVTQIFWPSILQSSNPAQLQQTPFNSIAVPPNSNMPCSSESVSCFQQNNLVNDNRPQNPLYMFPCPWLFPLPVFGNGQPSPSSSVKDKQDKLSLGKQCSSSSSLKTLANVDYQAALPVKLKTEASGWTEALPINDTGCATPRFSLDGASYNATSSLEKKQEQCICQGKNLVDAVAAAEARKRRKELTKQKSIHHRQSRMHC